MFVYFASCCQSVLPSSVAKTLMLDIMDKLFNQILIVTFDFYHFDIFIPLSLILIWAGGHKISTEQKTCWFLFLTHFSTKLEWMKLGVVMKQFKFDVLIFLLIEI